MQFQKEEIKDNILAAAREEFLKNGYEKASIRNITHAAETSKSNVYNYFHDKDALFTAVVEPTLLEIKNSFEKLSAQNSGTSAETYSIDAQEEVIVKIIDFVFDHGLDLKLLLFRSSGSSLTDFKERITKSLADILADWIYHAAPNKGISEYFIHTVAGFYIEAIEQILMQSLSKEQVVGQLEVYLKFVYGGWNAVFNNKTQLKNEEKLP